MNEILDDRALIRQYLEGDEASLELLIAKYIKPIFNFIYKNVGNLAEAEDITQDVFIRVWKNLKIFDQTKPLAPWVFQIAKNRSIDFLRKKKSIAFSRFENEKGQNVLIESIPSPTEDLIAKFSDEKVISLAMKSLTEKEQKIINMRHSDGMSFKEIAKSFNESINTVKSRYRRTLLSLRKNIEEKSWK